MDFFRTRKETFGWGIILGFLIWRLCEYVTGESEAWEAGPYLPVALIITGILVSVPCPSTLLSGAGGFILGRLSALPPSTAEQVRTFGFSVRSSRFRSW